MPSHPTPAPASATPLRGVQALGLLLPLLDREIKTLDRPGPPGRKLRELRSSFRASLLDPHADLIHRIPGPFLTHAQLVALTSILVALTRDLAAGRPRPTRLVLVPPGVFLQHTHTYLLWLLGTEIHREDDIALAEVDEELALALTRCVRSVIPAPALLSHTALSPEAARLAIILSREAGAFTLLPEDSAEVFARSLAAAPAATHIPR